MSFFEEPPPLREEIVSKAEASDEVTSEVAASSTGTAAIDANVVIDVTNVIFSR